MVLPGRDYVKGLRVAGSICGVKFLDAGDDRASGVLALPLQADWLLRTHVGRGTVEGHPCALEQLLGGGDGGCLGLL